MSEANPPQDALDLYEWAVNWCSERGIPASTIRVRWVVYKDITPESVWYYGDATEEESGIQFYTYPGRHWQNVSTATIRRYPNTVMGFYLSFDSSDDAAQYGFDEVIRPFKDRDISLVWVQPGHRLKVVSYFEGGMRLTCQDCGYLEKHRYQSEEERQLWVADGAALKETRIINPVQMVACIKRHQFDRVEVWDEMTQLNGTRWYKMECINCEQTFRKETDLIYERVEGNYSYHVIRPELTKMMGRCPGKGETKHHRLGNGFNATGDAPVLRIKAQCLDCEVWFEDEHSEAVEFIKGSHPLMTVWKEDWVRALGRCPGRLDSPDKTG